MCERSRPQPRVHTAPTRSNSWSAPTPANRPDRWQKSPPAASCRASVSPIQVAAAQAEALPCLVFDEVDAGVGGGVAEIVGRQLRTLGERAQVLCVTHLPQVASQAHAHIRVAKLTDGKTTRTSLHALTPDERVEEIARMLGGIAITDKAREHAAEMLRARSHRGEEIR